MSGYMAKLGSFVFSLDTTAFQSIERLSNYKWGRADRIGTAPQLQYTGKDSERITLAGTIYPHFRGGLGQMATIRAMADSGIPYQLVITDSQVGQVIGDFVVEMVRENRSVFFGNGAPRRIDFTINLVQYGGV